MQNRPGAVVAMQLASQHFGGQDHLIVIGGDTLFFEDFTLSGIVAHVQALPQESSGIPASLVLTHVIDDAGTLKSGILETDASNRVTAFLEKPGPTATTSRLGCPCFYVLSPAAQAQLAVFLEEKAHAPLAEKDAPGNFIKYLIDKVRLSRARKLMFVQVNPLPVRQVPVYQKEVSGRFDVGGLASYVECDKHFTKA